MSYPRMSAVSRLTERKLELIFDSGERRLFDAGHLLHFRAYAKLRDEAFFAQARAEYGSVCWPDNIDCCPDLLYQKSQPQ